MKAFSALTFPKPESAPGSRRRRSGGRGLRRLSDANLIAHLLAPEGEGRDRLRRFLIGRLKRHGLAALALTPSVSWPQDLNLTEEHRRNLEIIFELGRRVFGNGQTALTHPSQVHDWCQDLRDADRERFVAFYLDARHRIQRRKLISIGTLTASLVHPREVLGPALRMRAAALVVVHNHPSGDPEPSAEDCALTDRLRDGSKLLGIELLDHVIVARRGFVSLRERGYL